jgi:hypothetical protein
VFSQSPRTGKMEDLFWVRHQKAENKRERELKILFLKS